MEEKPQSNEAELEVSLKSSGKESIGVLNLGFLMQSIGGLAKNIPLTVAQDQDAQSVVTLMIEKKVGSALLLDESQRVVGIFTERDYLKKFAVGKLDPSVIPISDVSTLNPVTCLPETSIAYALNLMSHGGFRHIPVVDDLGRPIGVVSVRDVLDKISELVMNDLMSFEEA